MRKLSLICSMALAAFMFQACGGSGSKDTVETADSINAENDTSTSAAADSAGAGVAEYDAKFAVDATNGGMTEVGLSEIAKQTSANDELKQFADMMITDHKKAAAELTALATAKNITLPGAPGDDEQKVSADLQKKTGKDFDKAYIDLMVKDHDKTVSLFEDAAKKAVDADLKAFATRTLPTLKAHQTHAHALQAKIK